MKMFKFFAIISTLVALIITGVSAADSQPVAEVMYSSYGLSWNPNISYAKMVVSVAAPDGQVITHTFDSGVTPNFDLSQLKNGAIEGSYTYELRIIPSLPTNNIMNREKPELLNKLTTPSIALTQSGSFFVKGGSIVNPNISETPASTMDQVVVDDMIVSGSLCVGIDCVNGESFGFDTIRLRENNLRIKFQDTSNSGSFPTNDWQITANDSTNGGANKFSIDDIDSSRTPFTIEAGSPNNTLYVDSIGRIGIKTATPSVDIHTVNGNTPTLRLDQDGSSGFTPQVWDIAGNEANFFIRDVTNSSKLPFRIQPNAPSNTFYITNEGKIGMGTSSPSYRFHQLTDSSTNAQFVTERTGYTKCVLASTNQAGFFGTLNDFPVRLTVNNSQRAEFKNDNSLVMASGATCTSGGVWTSVSTREKKENIETLNSSAAFKAFKNLEPVTFNYKAEKGEKYVGFIAEDVPELVAKNDRKSLSTMDIVAVLTKVVQEQQKSIEELKKEIQELKNK